MNAIPVCEMMTELFGVDVDWPSHSEMITAGGGCGFRFQGGTYVTDVADKLFEIFSLDLDGRIGRLRVERRIRK